MKNKKMLIIIAAIVVIAAAGVGLYLYLGEDDSKSSDKDTKVYKNIEKKVEDAAQKWVKENGKEDKIFISELIEEDYLDEKALSTKDNKDTCDGYIEFDNSGKNVKTKVYIKCNNYTTKNYDEKVMETSTYKSISYELKNEDELNEAYKVDHVSLDSYEVKVTGNRNVVKKVDKVIVEVDLKDIEIDGEENSYKLKGLKLIPVDEDGEEVKGIELDEDTIDVDVYLRASTKTVPIKVVTTGTLAKGKTIKSKVINGTSRVTITAPESVLEKIEYVEATVDVDGLGGDETKEFKVAITKPDGVISMSETHTEVKIYFDDLVEKEVKLTSIEFKNLDSKYSATLKNQKDSNFSIKVKVAESISYGLSKYDFEAYVDLKDLEAGEHEVEVKVESKDDRYECSVSKKVKVVISE